MHESLDTSTPYGRAMIGILSAFAQLERDNIRQRTSMGMTKRVEDGYWMGGGRIPYGYDYDESEGILVPNEHADDVRKMFELYLEGYSTFKLAKMFNLTYDSFAKQILKRKTYTGVIVYNGVEYNGRHQPLITEELYEKVQRVMKQRGQLHTFAQSTYLLSGLLVCGVCGAKMRYAKWSSGLVKITCYSNNKSRKYLVKSDNCDNYRYNSKEVEEAVIADLFAHIDIAKSETKEAETYNVLHVLERKRDSLRSRINVLYMTFSADQDDELLAAIGTLKSDLNETLRLIEKEREIHSVTAAASAQIEELESLRDTWEYMTQDERRQILLSVIDKIVLDKDSVKIYYKL